MAPTGKLKLYPEQRVRHKKTFQHIFKHGRSYKGKYLNVWIYESQNEGQRPAFGIIVSRKTSKRAVGRNLWKRRIRESFRKNQGSIRSGMVLLILAKAQPGGKVGTYAETEADLKGILQKAKAWN